MERAQKTQKRLQKMWEIVEQALRAVFSTKSDMYALFHLVDDHKGFVNHKNFVKHMGRALRKEPAVMEELFGMLCRFVLANRKKSAEEGPLRVDECAESLTLRSRKEGEKPQTMQDLHDVEL